MRFLGGGLPWEEAVQEGWCAFLWAYRHHKRWKGVCTPWEVALLCIKERLAEAKRENLSARKWGTLSLNQPIPGSILVFDGPDFLRRESFLDALAFRSEMRSWDDETRLVAKMLIEDYSVEEIMERVSLNACGYDKIYHRLRWYMLEYAEC